ncbi:MAG: GDSL-type esterase/lipase family protein, partial [Victivallaceae bacterium]
AEKPAAVAEKPAIESATETAETVKAVPAVPEIVLGGFRQSFRQYSPASGWHYLWNASGMIGHAWNYRPLIWNNTCGAYTPELNYPAALPAKDLKLELLSGYPGQGNASVPDKPDHYVIIAYTLKENSRGNVWLTDGNIMKPIGGDEDTIEIRIYVNNSLRYSNAVSTGETPELFQKDLGPLKRGDTVYVAVGPDENAVEDMFHLDFNLKVLPAGEKPEAPMNLIKPPADVPEVKRLYGGKPSPGFLKKHEDFLKQAEAVKPDVVFLGDSITAGWLEAGKAIWDKHISVYKPLNLGVSGDQTEHVLWRITNGELDKIKPKVIVLMIGTNNLYMYSAEEICEGVNTILEELQSRLPQSKILLLGILPRAESPDASVRARIKEINEQLAQMADGTDIRFLDFGSALLEPDESISKEIMPDFLHLSEGGYNTWFDEMSPLLLDMLEPEKK